MVGLYFLDNVQGVQLSMKGSLSSVHAATFLSDWDIFILGFNIWQTIVVVSIMIYKIEIIEIGLMAKKETTFFTIISQCLVFALIYRHL